MALKVIGAGVGRTGTYSLRTALNQLGFGPCYHMEEIIKEMPARLPGWQDVVKGKADWPSIFKGYGSAVDWPTASYYRELHAAYPDAKFILTVRSPETFAASFGDTIYQLLSNKDQAPPPMREWLDMGAAVLKKAGFVAGLSKDALAKAFSKHTDDVVAAIPASKLLIYEVRQGWKPLCDFLGVKVPEEPYPVTNNRAEFWDRIKGAPA